MRKNLLIGSATLISLLTGAALVIPAFAQAADTQTATGAAAWGMHQDGMRGKPGVFGTVTAINGTTLTITRKAGPQGGTDTTYTVDASAATVTKGTVASSVSAIAVNDTVMVTGTVTGTTVAATAIRDGIPQGRPGGAGMMNKMGSTITGNGQPVIGGTVAGISGSTLTVTNKSNVTYTVDVSAAKIEKAGATASLSAVATGDTVMIQGTVNGTNVTASSVIDRGTPPAPPTGDTAQTPPNGHMGGFMSGIGGFFKKLFGFF